MSLPPRPEDDPRPQPPERPDDNACCQSGCDPCIFDLYNDEVTRYRADLKVWEQREAQRQASKVDAADAAKTANAEKATG
jgi:hypothetical protein